MEYIGFFVIILVWVYFVVIDYVIYEDGIVGCIGDKIIGMVKLSFDLYV